MIRDTSVTDSNYFRDFINRGKELNTESETRITNKEVSSEKEVRNRIFQKRLEILIAMYSNGDSIESIKKEYSIVLKFMQEGWDSSVVKFKMGKPSITYDMYYLNDSCHMIWMLSFGIFLNIAENEKEVLKKILIEDKITDEATMLLLSNLTQTELPTLEKTTIKPFASLVKNGAFINTKSLMKKYIDNWYKRTKLLTWHSYHPDKEGIYNNNKFYFGNWSFEAAAVTCILDLDDSNYREHHYYPKDLVDYYRKNKK
jgi:hypothetical protein